MMKKYSMGFILGTKAKTKENNKNKVRIPYRTKTNTPRKSVVQVYFPHRGTGWAYYNDKFDLKVGDFVYVDGKLKGYRGQVTEVNYSFKIKLSDYKKVVAVIDTDVKGDFYLAMSHLVSFDKNAIPFSKICSWFKAPENDDEYVCGYDADTKFSLDDLSKMNIEFLREQRGQDYFIENRVVYIEVNGKRGRATVAGSENYEIDFDYKDREISNIKCTCFCCGVCKHEYAAMLQLKEITDIISENYKDMYNDYFAAISKNVFVNTAMNNKTAGRISLGI